MTTLVTKRDGHKEPFDPSKVHKVVNWAIEGLSGVNLTDIELAARAFFVDGVTTAFIQQRLIKAAADLINEDRPDYQWVASRLQIWALRDEVWGGQKPISLAEILDRNVGNGKYTPDLRDYTKEELEALEAGIIHDRDYLHAYAGMVWLIEKYLVQDRANKRVFETPQFAYMAAAMTLCLSEPRETRVKTVLDMYDEISLHRHSMATPVLCGARTTLKQFASCTLFEVGDSLPSIASTAQALMYYSAQRAGLGINVGRIRPQGSPVAHGEIVHTGLIPFLKVFEATIKSCTQNGVRSGSATVFFPFWHTEVETLITLKNQTKGSQDRKVFKLDYCVALSNLFYERLAAGGTITLFSPNEAKGLYDAFGDEEKFRTLYEQYEADDTLKFKKQLNATDFFSAIVQECVDTGRLYVLNIDHANAHQAFDVMVRQSNLCVEIIQPTVPLSHIDDPEAEIGVCILSAENLVTTVGTDSANTFRQPDGRLAKTCRTIVRLLDNLIDYQEYPVLAGERFCRGWRSLGIGVTNMASWLAMNGLNYDHPDTPNRVSELMEAIQWHLLNASADLAAERGACPNFHKTKYARGLMPLDHYHHGVDEFVTVTPAMDWDYLRAKIAKHGLRHSTLTAQMPCESSSVVQNSTNGIEPPRGLVTTKKSKSGPCKQVLPAGILPQFAYGGRTNDGYIRLVAAMQKWMDMSISACLYYDYDYFPDRILDLGLVGMDIFKAWAAGVKTLYYTNTHDGDKQSTSEAVIMAGASNAVRESGCESGACTI